MFSGVGEEEVFEDVIGIHSVLHSKDSEREVAFGFSADVEYPVMIDFDFLVEVDGESIDIYSDGHEFTFDIELVAPLVDDEKFFVFGRVYF